MADLVIRGGTLVTPAGVRAADVAIAHERIVAIGTDLPAAAEEIDARGLTVLPGVIDVHVHFNEPGRVEWEGAARGSRALAAGGGTVFLDMPLNSRPCTVTVDAFDQKRDALAAASVTDFALWGGLVPGSVAAMRDLATAGVVGFKAFMCDSGLPEFPRADDVTLLEGMREAARLNLPVAVHAESEELTRAMAGTTMARDARAFLRSRPLAAELEAIQRALQFAHETGARLHIVHVSSGRGVSLAAEARAAGVDVSVETCPHYLFFSEDDLERLGTVAKCAPPLRRPSDRADLWDQLQQRHVDIVASDHSPVDPEGKRGDFMTAWGGVAGVQSMLAVLLDQGIAAGRLTLPHLAALVAESPARRFGLAGKGSVSVGRDADLVLVDLAEARTLRAEDLHQRHDISPYLGFTFRGTIRRTIRRGETIYEDGRIVARTAGRFIRPSQP